MQVLPLGGNLQVLLRVLVVRNYVVDEVLEVDVAEVGVGDDLGQDSSEVLGVQPQAAARLTREMS